MKKICRSLALILALVLLLSACDTGTPSVTTEDPATATQAQTLPHTEPIPTTAPPVEPETEPVVSMEPVDPEDGTLGGYAVSSSTKEATEAGLSVLRRGGNAVDAAVAVALALGVTEPYSSGLGGSGVMVVYLPEENAAYSLDYYACAGSELEMQDEVGVPGFLAGMQEALDRWGTWSMADAIGPAIDLAENGFPVSSVFARRLNYSAKLGNNPAFQGIGEGDTIIQQDLADTMKLIRDQGTRVFYSGQIAQDICDACGLNTVDLSSYKVYCTDALKSSFNGYKIYTTDAPTSGVVTSQMLTIADLKDIPNPSEDPQGYLDVMELATQIAYKTRRNKVVDPRFYDFNGKYLVSRKYVKKLLTKAEETLADENDTERRCTTQFSVIDNNGMIVCVTNTLSDNWGGYVLVDGFYLNNTLSNFGTTGKNAYEPFKRPRTHFSPVIAVGKDGSCLAIGSPGGENIPKVVSQVLIDVLQNDVDLQSAVDMGRYYFDSDGLLCLESATNADSRVEMGSFNKRYYFSSSHVIFGCTAIVGFNPKTGVVAVSDQRREGSEAQVERVRS